MAKQRAQHPDALAGQLLIINESFQRTDNAARESAATRPSAVHFPRFIDLSIFRNLGIGSKS